MKTIKGKSGIPSAAKILRMAVTATTVLALPGAAFAEPLVWGVQAEQFEYRFADGPDVLVWDFDAIAGSDELKFVWRSEGEYAPDPDEFEKLENQFRLQTPVTTFFDAVIGVRVSTPDGGSNRVHGVLGLHGLAPQWLEIDADLFVSDEPFFRFEVDYEVLITNRLILVPNIEVNLPFTDDPGAGVGAWAPTVEIGARLSYDLVDRMISPYIGVNYERAFGETGDLLRAESGDRDSFSVVLGTRLLF